jgi:hypothetical protein
VFICVWPRVYPRRQSGRGPTRRGRDRGNSSDSLEDAPRGARDRCHGPLLGRHGRRGSPGVAIGAPYPGTEPAAPDFADGWYGYVSKDLRDLLAANGLSSTPSAPYSRIYCGGGSLKGCRQALQASLLQALSATPKQIYGHGACAENPQASCFHMNRWVTASGVSVPPFPFQNRPTFQQVVELTKTLPR